MGKKYEKLPITSRNLLGLCKCVVEDEKKADKLLQTLYQQTTARL